MGFTLIIAEKPNASAKIAQALANGKPKTIETEDGVKYYEFTRNGKKHIAVPAVGHLFSLKDSHKGWTYPVFDYVWKPTYQINKKAFFAKKYFENIQRIAKDADSFIIATDFDNEGSVIGFNILRFLFRNRLDLCSDYFSINNVIFFYRMNPDQPRSLLLPSQKYLFVY